MVRTVFAKVSQEKEELTARLGAYFETDGEQPSEFSNTVDIITHRMGLKMADSIKATFLGIQSGEARNMQKVTSAIEQDMLGQKSPILATAYPMLSRILGKSPWLQPLAEQMLSRVGAPKNGDNDPTPPSNDPVQLPFSY
tara:strand:+ start:1502 stop:1921 length:420 start_codon:yes stop_codon:yes gene_type:complete